VTENVRPVERTEHGRVLGLGGGGDPEGWLAVAWPSSRTASRALPEPWSPSAWVSTAAALRAASGVSVNPASPARAAKMAASCRAV
jgi:hypothetical protein